MTHPSPYADLDDFEAWTKSFAAGGVDIHSKEAEELEWLLSASSICIDKHCRRVFFKSEGETRDFQPSWSPSTDVFVGDVLSVSKVEAVLSNGDTQEITPLPLLARTDETTALPYEPFSHLRFNRYIDRNRCGSLRVTGNYGWDSVPDDVRLVCLLLSNRFLSRPSSPTGAGGVGGFVVSMDPDTAKIMVPYRRRKTV